MSESRRLPEIPSKVLRDHGTDERVERVWQRLEGDLGTARARPRSALIWAPAALAIVFTAGVFVGSRWFRALPATPAQVTAEPTTVEERAAGAVTPTAQPGKAEHNPSKEKKGAPLVPHASGEPEQLPPPVGELPPASTAL